VCCLQRVLEAARKQNHHVLVVDNGSQDDTVDAVRNLFPGVDVIENRRNLGYSAGNNIGAKYLALHGCEYIGFINPDVELQDDTLSNLTRALAVDELAACAGGVPRLAGSELQRCFRREFTVRSALTIYSNVRYLPFIRWLLRPILKLEESRHYIDPRTLKGGDEVVAVSGCCVVFKTALFFKSGGFDDRSFLFCEEYMTAARLRSLGYKVIAVPEAMYRHQGSSSSSNVTGEFLWHHYCISEQIYVREYLGWNRRADILHMARSVDRAVCAACEAVSRLIGRSTRKRQKAEN
jgi:GT2 family glycosyltransferase